MVTFTTAGLLIAFVIVRTSRSSFASGLNSFVLSRREAIGAAAGFGGAASAWAVAPAAPLVDGSVAASSPLLALIPRMEFGAPATNVTIPADLVRAIEAGAAALERRSDMFGLASSPKLSGSWRLLYSNGAEIVQLAKGLPLGFSLGPTYQPLDTATGRFENRGNLMNRFNLAKLQTNVVGDVKVAQAGTLNAVGVRNDRGNRVDVDFRVISFELDEILGTAVEPALRKTLIPRVDPGVAQPANDITYLDETARIVRGGDGALFIFRREESGVPMLTGEEREALARREKSAGDAAVGVGAERFKDAAPELKFLFKDSPK